MVVADRSITITFSLNGFIHVPFFTMRFIDLLLICLLLEITSAELAGQWR